MSRCCSDCSVQGVLILGLKPFISLLKILCCPFLPADKMANCLRGLKVVNISWKLMALVTVCCRIRTSFIRTNGPRPNHEEQTQTKAHTYTDMGAYPLLAVIKHFCSTLLTQLLLNMSVKNSVQKGINKSNYFTSYYYFFTSFCWISDFSSLSEINHSSTHIVSVQQVFELVFAYFFLNFLFLGHFWSDSAHALTALQDSDTWKTQCVN